MEQEVEVEEEEQEQEVEQEVEQQQHQQQNHDQDQLDLDLALALALALEVDEDKEDEIGKGSALLSLAARTLLVGTDSTHLYFACENEQPCRAPHGSAHCDWNGGAGAPGVGTGGAAQPRRGSVRAASSPDRTGADSTGWASGGRGCGTAELSAKEGCGAECTWPDWLMASVPSWLMYRQT